jgi:hypothetical protein
MQLDYALLGNERGPLQGAQKQDPALGCGLLEILQDLGYRRAVCGFARLHKDPLDRGSSVGCCSHGLQLLYLART